MSGSSRGALMLAAVLLAGAAASWTLRATPHAQSAQPQKTADFFPMAAWYGGGKARAPMLEGQARSKKEAWRGDVRQIKALGFNAVRAWIDWASGQPVEARYDFETLDVLLELAEEEGLKLVLQVYMDSAPQWIGEKYPDSLFVSSNGQAIKPETSPGYCRDHPGVRAADTAFYAALAHRARRSPALVGWDLWSEPHVINWANPTWIPNPEFCFCPNTLERYRAWLRKKYGTIDKLNAAWYRRFEKWDSVEPSRMSTILSYTDYIDWKSFIVSKLGEDLRDRYQAVKRAAPATIVTSHAAGVGLFASPHHWEGQADDWTMAKEVDFYGTSFYPKHSAFVDRDPIWRAALFDFTRSFGYDEGRRGFWVGELQGGFGTISVNVSPTVTPNDLEVWTWTALSRAAKGINYYAWYPMSTGYESGGFGLNNLDGTITERAKTAGAIAGIVDRNQRLFLEARPPKAEVAVVYNPLAHFVGGRQRAAAYGGPQGEVVGIERDSLLGVHRALFPANVPLDYVHINHISAQKLAQYKLVIFPYPLMLPEASAPVLQDYVRAGGALVAEARLAWNNEKGYASERIPGLGLWEVMGARESAIETAPGGRTTIRWSGEDLPGFTSGTVLPARWYKETLAPASSSAKVVAQFEDGTAAAVMSSYGKGRTLMIGSYVSASAQSTPTPEAERFFRGVLQWAGVQFPVAVTGSPLEVRYSESGADTLLFVFNHSKSPARSEITMRRAPGRYTATDLVTGDAVMLIHDRDGIGLGAELPANDVRVLRISPR
ncbi:MAG TPA: beta-galactosidase [Vicinamibacterales bacterium]|nr:beta-galactosidase [Vicinamibacterales bacterium]